MAGAAPQRAREVSQAARASLSAPSCWRPGARTRMGGQKLLLPLAGRPLVQWAVDAALGSQADRDDRRRRPRGRAARGGPRGPAGDRGRQPALRGGDEHLAAGRGASAECGLRRGGLLARRPALRRLRAARSADRPLRGVGHGGRPAADRRPAGPPGTDERATVSRDPRAAAATSEVARSSSGIPSEVCLVPVDDRRVAQDIDSIEDYEAARESP